ncbi:4-deoxy-4-formamido-L-arabinose-phosphoundecaprenol deformylase [Sulfuriferula sp. AH1]|uniref:polysaccharide deacetylase family protein n=1 Tax=Sulfuriferula sp. AH1 TaxID=1985873 RepID=UPI000B3B52CC|nr:polysaccharide deacetylase family protein [Sulfuriferula sp. AH1]ARU31451.1 4-deoxy-4-formamido-L-arabinose-phosphoundecaprenol deformylase [Sulfuriferula sp. AH1]
MRLLALKIDVDTYRGTREGVPQLVNMLIRHGAGATFLFSLGPDHTGRAVRRALRPGFMKKVSRTSVLEHYGLKTLLYGTLLPGPDIGRKCAPILRDVAAAGFETGIHTYDHVKWQDNVARQTPAWTQREMDKAYRRYLEVFGTIPTTHCAAGWQMNDAAYLQEKQWEMTYASDSRGTHPFIPVLANGETSCAQLPTTLPTLDEIIGTDGIDTHNVADAILKMTADERPYGHVYTLHAELEGQKLAPIFEQLLSGWKQQGYRLVSLADYYAALDSSRLPEERVIQGEIPGRSGKLALQSS